MKKALFVMTIVILAMLVSAEQAVSCGNGGMGGMGGTGGGMMMGDMDSARVVVADDGSVLVMESGTGMMGGWGSTQATMVNISADGNPRWQIPFDGTWPMMLATNGDLVVVVVSSSTGGMWGGGMWGNSQGVGQSWILGIDLETGNKRWQVDLSSGMASYPQFIADGSQFYVTVGTSNGYMGTSPMDQGGWGSEMQSTLIAFDRNGKVVWERDMSDQNGGWTP